MPDKSIDITVVTEYLPSQSDSDQSKFAFAYHIAIKNQGTEGVQLISRRWLITDGNQSKREVQGIGVVGEQPFINSCAQFQYTSGIVLNTPVGTMEGYYQMITESGESFEAVVTPFLLAVPGEIH